MWIANAAAGYPLAKSKRDAESFSLSAVAGLTVDVSNGKFLAGHAGLTATAELF